VYDVLTVCLAYLAASVTAAALFVLLVWSGHVRLSQHARPSLDVDALTMTRPRAADVDPASADVAAAARSALARVEDLIRRRGMRVEFAVMPGLRIRLPAERLSALIEDMLTTVIRAESGATLLLTAERHGGRVDILLSDDSPVRDSSWRAGECRDLAERAALLGGSLDVTSVPLHGTTLTLRLAAPAEAPPAEAHRKSNGAPPVSQATTTAQLL